MSIKSSTLDGGIGLIEVNGSLIGGDETDRLRRAIADFVARGYDKLLIDMTGSEYLNSTAVGVLMHGLASYARRKWRLRLCGINKKVNAIFVIAKLNLVFDVYDTREDAIKNFQQA